MSKSTTRTAKKAHTTSWLRKNITWSQVVGAIVLFAVLKFIFSWLLALWIITG